MGNIYIWYSIIPIMVRKSFSIFIAIFLIFGIEFKLGRKVDFPELFSGFSGIIAKNFPFPPFEK
jgi:hypothetical protein